MQSYENNQQITHITIDENMPASCFKDCRHLQCIAISEKVTYISAYCFRSTCLDIVKLPESIETIEEYAFENCRNLTEIYFICLFVK